MSQEEQTDKAANVMDCRQATKMVDGRRVADFGGFRISAEYQSVYSVVHQRQVGFDAFLRADSLQGDAPAIHSETLFSQITPNDICTLNHLRMFLLVDNFMQQGIDDRWLFLTVNPRIIQNEEPDLSFIQLLMERTNLKPHQVVLSLLSHSTADEEQIARVIGAFKDMGALVLFDDYCSETANLDRLWRYRPHFVKLKRNLIINALANPQAKRMLNKLVSLIHASGCMVLMEEIETEEEAIMAIWVSADFVQGKYFSGLEATAERRGHNKESQTYPFATLAEKSAVAAEREAQRQKQSVSLTSEKFLNCAWAVEDGASLQKAGRKILAMREVERLYLLNGNGIQVGPNLFGKGMSDTRDLRFIPLEDSTGATWCRRSNFFDAIRNLRVVQVSPPYRSITSLNVVVTFSVTLRIKNRTHVLCCDIRWDEGLIL